MADPWWKKSKEPKVYAEWQVLKTPEGLTYYYNTKTNTTTWDKPDALKTDDELSSAGEWFWCPDEKECYVPARLTGRGAGGAMNLQTQDGSTITIPSQTLDPLKLSSLQRVVADLTLLDNMTVPLILHNLRKRFEDKKIYTNIGTILISINPYTRLPLYTPEVIYEYQYRGLKEMPPHVFNIAHDSYKGLTEFNINQSVIISGESGAGKTEATKQCLSYLAAIAGSVGGVEQKILLANPILEAFGNAKTLRNDNSSRFGKYMEVFFNKDKQICGSTTTNYLLEKIRVVKQQAGERNYHVFYQLTKAASAAERKELCVGEPTDYSYLATSGCVDVAGVDDSEDFSSLKDAFDALAFTKPEQKQILTIVSLILALGNVEFRRKGDKECDIPDRAWLDVAAGLLQVPGDALMRALLVRELKIKGAATTDIKQGVQEASNSRDALGKFVYGNLFNWLVVKINRAMGTPPKGCKSIGILDIFGFEIFQENSFEQLCINFTNEMLQQHFNSHTFKLEEQVYKTEKISFKHVEFIDNQPVLDLIEQKGRGILPILDEELVVPKGSDATFLAKLNTQHEKATAKYYKRVLKNPAQFMLVHYAGNVIYDTANFLEKNRDTLTDDLVEMVQKSRMPLLLELFPKAGTGMSTADKKASLSKQFQKQLHDLMTTLNNTEPHYIRCVKPNEFKSPSTFVSRMTMEQLRYSGVFEAVAIRKQGYPFRLTHGVFYERYRCILANPEQKFPNEKAGCLAIIDEMKLEKTNVQTGVTMMLYRADEHKNLELQYSVKVEKIRMNQTLTELIAKRPDEMKEADREKFFEQLSRSVNMANEFNLQTEVANTARKLLDDFIESRMDDDTRALLEAAKAAVDEEKLAAAIAVSDQYDYATKLVKECKRLYGRVKRINEEAALAVDILEELPMQVVLDAADEIKQTTETIAYIRNVLSQTKDVFIKMQMQAATRLRDTARCIRITIRLKDLAFQRVADSTMFNIQNYSKLKRPDEWAAERFFNFSAEEFSAKMLKHTRETIHAPLTDIKAPDVETTKRLKKKAVSCFSMIQKYMGDRKDKDDVGTGREVVAEGLSTPLLRDEIYLHIIKQLSDNPSPESVSKGWKMLALCLTTFPPGADFENFLEVYLRKYATPAPKYVGALHKISFEGAMRTPPTLEQMVQVEETLATRSRGFSEPLPPAQPSYQDLLDKYLAQEEIHNEFQRKAPKPAKKAAGAAATGAGPAKRAGGAGAAGAAGAASPRAAAAKAAASPRAAAAADGEETKESKAPAKAPAKAAPAPKVVPTAWKEAADPSSGAIYYYNEETGESSWDRPPALNPAVRRMSAVSRGW